MHCALFQEFIENIFKFSTNLGVWNESTVKSASSHVKDLKTVFLYLAEYSVKNFIYDKAICCKSYVQLLIQDVYLI